MGRKNLLWLGGLTLANLLLLAGIAQVWFSPRQPSGAVGRHRLTLPRPKPLRSRENLDNFNVVVAKNLFSPERRGAETGTAPGQTLEDGLLLGTIIVGDQKAVLLGQKGVKGRQKVQVLRPGEEWRGYRLVEITENGVIFQGKEGKRSLTFPRPKLSP
ncbi:MAG: hypothetical protein JRI59_06075 [Deltaproteobacteria bacterium]|nr:hypothetical protein [Deltaproteobacteria bacterium]